MQSRDNRAGWRCHGDSQPEKTKKRIDTAVLLLVLLLMSTLESVGNVDCAGSAKKKFLKMSHQPQPLDLCGWQPSEAPFDFLLKAIFFPSSTCNNIVHVDFTINSRYIFTSSYCCSAFMRVCMYVCTVSWKHKRVKGWWYLVLGSILSVAYVRSHNPLCLFAQHGEDLQLQSRRTDTFLSEFSSWIQFFRNNAQSPRRGYLGGALAHSVDQLLDDHVHALDAGLLQFDDLLLHDSLERHVGGEKSSPAKRRRKKNLGWRKVCFSTLNAAFYWDSTSPRTNCGPRAVILFYGNTDRSQVQIRCY